MATVCIVILMCRNANFPYHEHVWNAIYDNGKLNMKACEVQPILTFI